MEECKPNGIITLTTDFGTQDIFVGVMKGIVTKINREATLIDITHSIPPQDIEVASFLFGAAYSAFPVGTIHLVVIDPGVGGARRALVVQTKDCYFIAPDNGVLTEALANYADYRAVYLTNHAYFLPKISNTFHGRDIFAPVAAHLSKRIPLSKFGTHVKDLKRIPKSIPRVAKSCIEGQVRYIDKFGNLITNISETTFREFCKTENFQIRINKRIIRSLYHSYDNSAGKNLIAIFNSFNLLELAMYKQNTAIELNVSCGAPVLVEILSTSGRV